MSHLQDREQYEERYDKITVELCRDRERTMQRFFGERPPLDSHGEADPANGYYVYSILYFQFVESLAGELWQEREVAIGKWIAADKEKDRRLAEAKPSTIPYCRSCGEDMEIKLKTHASRERGGAKKDEDDILFMFRCVPCNTRMASWQDGTEWKPRQTCCEHCGVPVDETDTVKDNVITSTYTCGNCGHNYKNVWVLGATTEVSPDPHFKLDRRRFCFDAATGKKFLARKAHIEQISDMVEKASRGTDGSGQTPDPLAGMVGTIQRLKVAQVADLLAKAVANDGYTDFKLGEVQVGREVVVPFSCLDNRPERGDYDSRTGLKKLITSALIDTNWQLMSQGVSYRLGYLSGRLRAYESEEELHKLVGKQLKAGTRRTPVAQSALVPEPTAQPEPPPTPKRSRRGKQRAIQVRGVLHPNLHILIPPREAKKPSPKPKKKKQ